MAGFVMKVNKDKIEGFDVIPAGPQEVRLVEFKPEASKSMKAGKGFSVNLNAKMVIIGNPDLVNRFLFDSLNTPGGAFYHQDFAHCFGLPMETDGKDYWLPGNWDGDPAKFKEDDPSTWVYKGPLVGRVGKVEVEVDNYNGKDNNKIRRYFCAIPDCATKFPKIRHLEQLNKKSE